MSRKESQIEIRERAERIEELIKAIEGPKKSWSNLYSDEKKVGNRVD